MRELAQVAEHDCHVPFDSPEVAVDTHIGVRHDLCRQQGRDRDVALRINLTGQPHVGGGTKPAQHALFKVGGGRQVVLPFHHADPAGRTPGSTPANRGMGDPVHATDCKDRQSPRRVRGGAVDIGHRDPRSQPIGDQKQSPDRGSGSEKAKVDPVRCRDQINVSRVL